MYLWPRYFEESTTEGDEYAYAPAITPWNTNVDIKYAMSRIMPILI